MKRYVTITISADTKRILDERYTFSGELTDAVLRPDGCYDIRLSQATIERLRHIHPNPEIAIESLIKMLQLGRLQ